MKQDVGWSLQEITRHGPCHNRSRSIRINWNFALLTAYMWLSHTAYAACLATIVSIMVYSVSCLPVDPRMRCNCPIRLWTTLNRISLFCVERRLQYTFYFQHLSIWWHKMAVIARTGIVRLSLNGLEIWFFDFSSRTLAVQVSNFQGQLESPEEKHKGNQIKETTNLGQKPTQYDFVLSVKSTGPVCRPQENNQK